MFEQVSELLTLLGHVELVRQKAVENANQLLELDGRHEQKAGGEAVVSMSAHERAQLSNVLKRIVEARETYVTCIKWIPLHVCLASIILINCLTKISTSDISSHRVIYTRSRNASRIITAMIQVITFPTLFSMSVGVKKKCCW